MSMQDMNRTIWIRKQAAEPQTLFGALEEAGKNLPEGYRAEVQEVSPGKFRSSAKYAPERGIPAAAAEYETAKKAPGFVKKWKAVKLTPKGYEYAAKEGLKTRIGWAAAKAGLVGSGLLLATGGVALGKHVYDKLMGPVEFRKDFNAAMEHDKTLKQYDRDQVESRFRTLRKFNPDMSKDPFVASSFIRQTMEMPHVTAGMVRELTSARPEKGRAGSSDATRLFSNIVGDIV